MQKPLRYLWTGIKVFLSALLIALALVIYAMQPASPTSFTLIAALLVPVALLWLQTLGNSRWNAAILCVFVAVFCAFCTYQGIVNGFGLPSDCSVRRGKLICHVINATYGVVGPGGLVATGATVTAYLLWAARSFLKESGATPD